MTNEEAIAAVESCADRAWWDIGSKVGEELTEALPVLRALLADAKLGRELEPAVRTALTHLVSAGDVKCMACGWLMLYCEKRGTNDEWTVEGCPRATLSAALARARTP